MTDVAAIVRGLSEAQRRALAMARRDQIDKLPRIYGHAGVTRKALRERGLAHGDPCYLTPLGDAVRTALMEEGR